MGSFFCRAPIVLPHKSSWTFTKPQWPLKEGHLSSRFLINHRYFLSIYYSQNRCLIHSVSLIANTAASWVWGGPKWYLMKENSSWKIRVRHDNVTCIPWNWTLSQVMLPPPRSWEQWLAWSNTYWALSMYKGVRTTGSTFMGSRLG